jgi:hypothetical protein
MTKKMSIFTCMSIAILFFVLSGFSNQNVMSQNTTLGQGSFENQSAVNTTENANNSSSVKSFANPADLNLDEFPLNTKMIAKELTELNPTEISNYPITKLSPNDLKLAFILLNPFNLGKVLLNIPQDDLLKIQNILSPSLFNQTLNRLLPADKDQVEDRLSHQG